MGLLLITREPAFLRAVIRVLADPDYNDLVSTARTRIDITSRLAPPDDSKPHDAIVAGAIYWILAQLTCGARRPQSPITTPEGQTFHFEWGNEATSVLQYVRYSLVALLHPSGTGGDDDAVADARHVVQVCSAIQRMNLVFKDDDASLV